jgi:hypothetical protein
MSSVSKSSRFSAKSQIIIEAQDKVIAEQGGQISNMAKEMALMKKMLVEAGIKTVSGEVEVEVKEKKTSKKRLPSGSPDGKMWLSSSCSGSDSAGEALEDCEASKSEDWRKAQHKKGRPNEKKLSKKEAKKARRLERAKENKLNAKVIDAASAALESTSAPVDKPTEHVSSVTSVGVDSVTDPTNTGFSTQRRLYSSIAASGQYHDSRSRFESDEITRSQVGSSMDAEPVITPVFKTPMSDGPYRDEIVVEILSLDGKDFVGTITPTEARKVILEEVLGFTQEDLSGIKIGFNRGRIITYKLKQQHDIDKLYKIEFFDFKRSRGLEVSTVSCKIRGVRDPTRRNEQATRQVRQPQEQWVDDGTRIVRIIGCEYRLLESEILDWLCLYGEVITEITEEPYEDEQGSADKLPPIGNGTYLVTMRLKKDMPNWVPMYGRKVCLSYKGITKECNSCYGPHLKKFCKNERMSLEEYADKFRAKNMYVPEQLYGKLAKLENIAEQAKSRSEVMEKTSCVQSGSVSGAAPFLTDPKLTSTTQQPKSFELPPQSLKVTLRRSGGEVWTSKQEESLTPMDAPNPERAASGLIPHVNLPIAGVADR